MDIDSMNKVVNLVVLGDRGCGKTTLLYSVNTGYYPPPSQYAPPSRNNRLQLDSYSGVDVLYIESCDIDAFDCPGGCVGCLIAIDCSDDSASDCVNKWISKVRGRFGDDVAVVICGTKTDLRKAGQGLSNTQGLALAKVLNTKYVDSNPVKGTRVPLAFQTAAKLALTLPDRSKSIGTAKKAPEVFVAAKVALAPFAPLSPNVPNDSIVRSDSAVIPPPPPVAYSKSRPSAEIAKIPDTSNFLPPPPPPPELQSKKFDAPPEIPMKVQEHAHTAVPPPPPKFVAAKVVNAVKKWGDPLLQPAVSINGLPVPPSTFDFGPDLVNDIRTWEHVGLQHLERIAKVLGMEKKITLEADFLEFHKLWNHGWSSKTQIRPGYLFYVQVMCSLADQIESLVKSMPTFKQLLLEQWTTAAIRIHASGEGYTTGGRRVYSDSGPEKMEGKLYDNGYWSAPLPSAIVEGKMEVTLNNNGFGYGSSGIMNPVGESLKYLDKSIQRPRYEFKCSRCQWKGVIVKAGRKETCGKCEGKGSISYVEKVEEIY